MRAARIVIPETAFRSDHPGQNRKRPRDKNRTHLDWLKTLPCIVTGIRYGIDPAHIRYPDARFAKRAVGMQEKPDDCWAVPLCRVEHDKQHSMDELEYWEQVGIDPIPIAIALYRVSGDDEAGDQIIRSVKP